jgi:hypothetical protein
MPTLEALGRALRIAVDGRHAIIDPTRALILRRPEGPSLRASGPALFLEPSFETARSAGLLRMRLVGGTSCRGTRSPAYDPSGASAQP